MSAAQKPRAKFSPTRRHHIVMRAIMASDLSSTERLVLFVIEGHVTFAERESGRCWPSMPTLADASGLCRAAVARAVSRLEEIGWLEVTRRTENGSPTSNAYRVTPPNGSDSIPRPPGRLPPVH